MLVSLSSREWMSSDEQSDVDVQNVPLIMDTLSDEPHALSPQQMSVFGGQKVLQFVLDFTTVCVLM